MAKVKLFLTSFEDMHAVLSLKGDVAALNNLALWLSGIIESVSFLQNQTILDCPEIDNGIFLVRIPDTIKCKFYGEKVTEIEDLAVSDLEQILSAIRSQI